MKDRGSNQYDWQAQMNFFTISAITVLDNINLLNVKQIVFKTIFSIYTLVVYHHHMVGSFTTFFLIHYTR